MNERRSHSNVLGTLGASLALAACVAPTNAEDGAQPVANEASPIASYTPQPPPPPPAPNMCLLAPPDTTVPWNSERFVSSGWTDYAASQCGQYVVEATRDPNAVNHFVMGGLAQLDPIAARLDEADCARAHVESELWTYVTSTCTKVFYASVSPAVVRTCSPNDGWTLIQKTSATGSWSTDFLFPEGQCVARTSTKMFPAPGPEVVAVRAMGRAYLLAADGVTHIPLTVQVDNAF